MIDQYLSALNLRDQWKFQGGLSFLNESNINNAPKAGTRIGNWNAWERESATGFSYFAEAEKNGHYPIIISLNFLLREEENITGIIKNIMNLMVESVLE